MTIDDAIAAFGQVVSDDFDSIELEVRDYERLVKWLTELKLARESAFSDIGLAARAVSENNQLKVENGELRALCKSMRCALAGYEDKVYLVALDKSLVDAGFDLQKLGMKVDE